jgi:hypothetical protein
MSKPYLRIFSGEDERHIMFLMSPISSYCYDLMKTLSSGRAWIQLFSEYQALAAAPNTVIV